MNISKLIRRIKCAFKGHRIPAGYGLAVPPYVGVVGVPCERCGDRLNVVPMAGPTTTSDKPDITAPPEIPDAPDTPPADSEHIIKRISVWFGPNLSSASVDSSFKLTVSNNGRDWSAAPDSWPSGRAGAGCPSDCNVMCCAAYKTQNGKWVGGKFDWNRPRPSPRSWENVANGYNGWVAPQAGTEMVCWCYTQSGNRVSLESTTTYG